MYLKFFGFTKEPFHVTPDPDFLYLSPTHQEALAIITYGVEKRMGFMAIVGGVGLGKTTILRSFLEHIDHDRVRIVVVFNPNASFLELLQLIYAELHLELPSENVYDLVTHFYGVLIEEYKQDRNVVLIIDEAQNMPIETLEQLRMLSNLETTNDKLLQIVLVGQPELDVMLNSEALRQLKQRIAVRGTLVPLNEKESVDYVHHRLAKVSTVDTRIFTQWALRRIVRYSKGIPRTINIICDNALVAAYGYQKKQVSYRMVQEVIGDFEGESKPFTAKRVLTSMAILVMVCGFLATAYLYRGSLLAGRAGNSSPTASVSPLIKKDNSPAQLKSKESKTTIQGISENQKGLSQLPSLPPAEARSALDENPKDAPAEEPVTAKSEEPHPAVVSEVQPQATQEVTKPQAGSFGATETPVSQTEDSSLIGSTQAAAPSEEKAVDVQVKPPEEKDAAPVQPPNTVTADNATAVVPSVENKAEGDLKAPEAEHEPPHKTQDTVAVEEVKTGVPQEAKSVEKEPKALGETNVPPPKASDEIPVDPSRKGGSLESEKPHPPTSAPDPAAIVDWLIKERSKEKK